MARLPSSSKIQIPYLSQQVYNDRAVTMHFLLAVKPRKSMGDTMTVGGGGSAHHFLLGTFCKQVVVLPIFLLGTAHFEREFNHIGPDQGFDSH